MSYLEVDGGRRLYYEDHQADGCAVVLIHGWGVSTRCWDTVLPALWEQGCRVVTLDLRCNGRSDKDFSDVSIEALGSDVVALVDALRLQRPVLNGWSAGGAVVVEAAARLGARLGGLVLTGGATPRYTKTADWEWGDTLEGVQGTIAAIRADRATVLAGVAAAVCHADVGQHVVDWMHGMFLEAGPRGDEWLIDLAQVDQRAQLGQIAAPSLVLAGRHDTFVAHDAQAAAADLLSDARLVSFEQSGHAPFLEEGERYCRELVDFVAGL